jgi:hypothetical protein
MKANGWRTFAGVVGLSTTVVLTTAPHGEPHMRNFFGVWLLRNWRHSAKCSQTRDNWLLAVSKLDF